MKKTFVTTMPDRIGAFLRASRCFAALGVNISRVSYNKAVDLHTLFIEAEGTPEQLEQAGRELTAIGYLQSGAPESRVMLTEFTLIDRPGSVGEVLEVIRDYHFNISYMSSQEDGSGTQHFKMGLLVEDPARVEEFLRRVAAICPVRVLEYDRGEKNYDNSIFYESFAQGLAELAELPEEERRELLIEANLAMQRLDERDLSPAKTFECIRRFAELLRRGRGEGFAARVSFHVLSDKSDLWLIEPPCGSNTMIVRSGGKTLLIDSGYAFYREEMLALLRRLLPGYDEAEKQVLVTHADVDHCGLLPLFDRIYVSRESYESLCGEREGGGLREANPLHAPYVRICKLLTHYRAANPERMQVICGHAQPGRPFTPGGHFRLGDLDLEIQIGAGGHLPGEIVLIEREKRLLFTGDVWVNPEGFTREQEEYNRYAPILMTSVDTDPALAHAERAALRHMLEPGVWRMFGAHGAMRELTIR